MTIRLVVADDHPMVTRGLGAVVAAATDLELVATAASGREALEACRMHQPDLVVLDVDMSDGNGGAVARQLLVEQPRARVLMLSMHADDESVFAALRAGAHGYLVKGAGCEQVMRAMRAVAAGEAIFGADVAARVLQHFGAAPPPLPGPLEPLSARECEVLDLLASGLGTKEIALRLFLSPKTVRNHIASVVAKLRLADRAHAIAYARQAGLGR
jgi:DNA-binding NarL/FixJ family response regulator